MPVPLLVAGGVAAVGAGVAAYGAAKKGVKSNAANYAYGGSADAANKMRAAYQQRDEQAHAQGEQYGQLGLAARSQQEELAREYKAVTDGTGGPSLAELQMRAGQQRVAQQGMAMAAATRGGGGNLLAAQRMAQQNAMMGGQEVNAQAAQLRAAEVEQARQARAALAFQMRGGDLASQGLYEQRSQAGLEAGLHVNDQQLAASMAYDQAAVGLAQKNKDRWMQIGGGLMNLGGQMYGKMGAAGAGGAGAGGGGPMYDSNGNRYMTDGMG